MEDPRPGFRFYPTEAELVSFYLYNKLEGNRVQEINRVIPVVNIYEYNPWDLRQLAGEYSRRDPEQWFFFIPMQEREARGGRPNRLTTEGYWKATGSPGYVFSSNHRIIGGKRTMVFYKGRAPNGRKTQWKMNEYRSIEGASSSSSSTAAPPKLRQELSICRVYIKSKSLRAFDRRPPPPLQPLLENNASTTSHQNHPAAAVVVPERTSSPGSSSSGDGADEATHSLAVGSINSWNSIVDYEPMWDWEHLLEWF